MSGFAVIDLETTGLNARTESIIEVGVVLLDSAGNLEGRWTTLINPRRAIRAQFIHGISDDDVTSSPTFAQILPELVTHLEFRAIVAHNAVFDVGFLNEEFKRVGFPMSIPDSATVCTMELSKMYLPAGRHSLDAAAQRAGISVHNHHRALADAETAAELLRVYLDAEKAGTHYENPVHTRSGGELKPASWVDAQIRAAQLGWPIALNFESRQLPQ
ncbi:3'-5' exonuclease [Ancrocorticia populi]|uniref:3'-5' exonuclease n=1 Tax=Ancrocorticia populi TaxID=2175228 RepID=A0A2V1K4R9_9ACTO|nr:3'-5' exonuclease [Ancrocorticia populi]PWF24547.1 3'-5' exonuclease [Ancrocorticia populi]